MFQENAVSFLILNFILRFLLELRVHLQQTAFISTLLFSYPVFLFVSISPVNFIFSTHLSSNPLVLFQSISAVTFNFFSYLFSYPSSFFCLSLLELSPFLLSRLPFSVSLSYDFHLSSYPVFLFLTISPATFIFSTYLSSYSVSILLPISPVTFIFSSIQSSFFWRLEPTSLFDCRGYNYIALSHCLWVCEYAEVALT